MSDIPPKGPRADSGAASGSEPGNEPGTTRVIGFAHRGARLEAPDNSLEAFTRALAAGAAGLETDCRLSADGAVVCAHDPVVGRGLRRRKVRDLDTAELAELGIPRLADVFAALGSAFELSVDAQEVEVVGPLLAVVAAAGATERLWLCHPDLDVLNAVRATTTAHLVHSRRSARLATPHERHAHDLAAAGIEVMNFHHTDWTAGLVSLFHRFGIRAFAWDAQETRHLARMLDIGIDGLYCDRPDRLVAAIAEWNDGRGSATRTGPVRP